MSTELITLEMFFFTTKFKFKFKSFIESRTDNSTWIANAIKG